MNASKLSDSCGNNDMGALSALSLIIQNCHHLVLTNEMERGYFEKIDLLKKKKELKLDIIPLLKHAYIMEGKVERKSNDLEHVVDEHLIPKNDRNILRLAFVSKGTIVTSDTRLLNALENHNFKENYGIEFTHTKNIRTSLSLNQ
jgi:hypothetical protein